MSKAEYDPKQVAAIEKYYKTEVLKDCAICQEFSWKAAPQLQGTMPLVFNKADECLGWDNSARVHIAFSCMSCGHTLLINWNVAQAQIKANGVIRCRTCKQDVPRNNLSETPDEPECDGCYKRERTYIFGVLYNRGCSRNSVEGDLCDLVLAANKAGLSNLKLKEIAAKSDSLSDFGIDILESAGFHYSGEYLEVAEAASMLDEA